MNNWVKMTNDEMEVGIEIATLKKGELQIKYAKDIVAKDKEIERLKQDNEYLNKVNIELSSRNSKAIEYIETHQLNFKKNITTFGSERLSMEERKLLDILRGVDKE